MPCKTTILPNDPMASLIAGPAGASGAAGAAGPGVSLPSQVSYTVALSKFVSPHAAISSVTGDMISINYSAHYLIEVNLRVSLSVGIAIPVGQQSPASPLQLSLATFSPNPVLETVFGPVYGDAYHTDTVGGNKSCFLRYESGSIYLYPINLANAGTHRIRGTVLIPKI